MKQPCEFCHGITNDDVHGNCSACGAPRAENSPSWSDLHKVYETVSGTPVKTASVWKFSEGSWSSFGYPVTNELLADCIVDVSEELNIFIDSSREF